MNDAKIIVALALILLNLLLFGTIGWLIVSAVKKSRKRGEKPKRNQYPEKPKSAQVPPSVFMRDMLYGELLFDNLEGKSETEPWLTFSKAKKYRAEQNLSAAITELEKISNMPNLESRFYLQAWYFLRELGVKAPEIKAREIHGVVLEIGYPTGTDILAVYCDHRLRSYPATGGGFLYEAEDAQLNLSIDRLLEQAERIIPNLHAHEVRPSIPNPNYVYVHILASGGIYTAYDGRRDNEQILKDPMLAPLFETYTEILGRIHIKISEIQAAAMNNQGKS